MNWKTRRNSDAALRDLERKVAAGDDPDAMLALVTARIRAGAAPASFNELIAALPRWRELERIGVVVRLANSAAERGLDLMGLLGAGFVGDGEAGDMGDIRWWGHGHPDRDRLRPGVFTAYDSRSSWPLAGWLVVVEPGASQEIRDRLARLAERFRPPAIVQYELKGGDRFHPSCFFEATKSVDSPFRGRAIERLRLTWPRGSVCGGCGGRTRTARST